MLAIRVARWVLALAGVVVLVGALTGNWLLVPRIVLRFIIYTLGLRPE